MTLRIEDADARAANERRVNRFRFGGGTCERCAEGIEQARESLKRIARWGAALQDVAGDPDSDPDTVTALADAVGHATEQLASLDGDEIPNLCIHTRRALAALRQYYGQA